MWGVTRPTVCAVMFMVFSTPRAQFTKAGGPRESNRYILRVLRVCANNLDLTRAARV